MRCMLCNSPRTLKFLDGFGDRRIFCRGCGRSFLETNFMMFGGQRKLQEFGVGTYPKAIHFGGDKL